MYKKYFLVFQVCISLAFAGYQNYVNYNINVELNPDTKQLVADETIVFYNNSPDTLNEICLLLYPNTYKNDSTSFAREMIKRRKFAYHFCDESEHGFIDIHKTTENGKPNNVELVPDSIDIGMINLISPLLPGDSVCIELEWTEQIPKLFSRGGYKGTHFQITQWFPKIPVYDENGWYKYPYLEVGEFFYEFGNYEVDITVPERYLVVATGDMQNYHQNEDSTRTYEYELKKAVDFAWYANPRFDIHTRDVNIDSTRLITLSYYRLPESVQSPEVVLDIMENAFWYFYNMTGIFPYNSLKVVEGQLTAGGGMEYPTLAEIHSGKSLETTALIIGHEIGHTWFYNIFGFNERQTPWLDEGINSWAEMDFMQKVYPHFLDNIKIPFIKNADFFKLTDLVLTNYEMKKSGLTSGNSSEDFPNNAYFTQIYKKPVLGLNLIKEYYSDSLFYAAVSQFSKDCQFTHPTPENIQESLEKVLDDNLDWFFDDFINSTKKNDYAVSIIFKDIEDEHYTTTVQIENFGELYIPVKLALYNRKDSVICEEWVFPGEQNDSFHFETDEKVSYCVADPDRLIPDICSPNNNSKRLPKITAPWNLDVNEYRNQLITFPYPYYYYTAGFQIGLALMNVTLPPAKHRFVFKGAYGFKNQHFSGQAHYQNTLFFPGSKNFVYGTTLEGAHDNKKYSAFGIFSTQNSPWGELTQKFETKVQYLAINPNHHLDNKIFSSGQFLSLIGKHTGKKEWGLNQVFLKTRIKGINITDNNKRAIRISTSLRYTCRIGYDQIIRARIFAGKTFSHGTLPNHERFYASGDVDPDFEDVSVFDRSGETWASPGQNWYLNSGMMLKGFLYLSDAKSGASLNLLYKFSPFIAFFDVGKLSQKSNVYFDIGTGLSSGPMKIYIPLFVNVPQDNSSKLTNKNNLKNRFSISLDVMNILTQLGIE